MEENRKRFLEECQNAIDNVKTDTWSIEEAAYNLVGLLLEDTDLLKHLEIQAIFDTLDETEIPREVSYVQPIGTWNKEVADRIKKEEWEQVVAAVEYAERISRSQ